MADYVVPTFTSDAFNCPHCGAFAHQKHFPWVYMAQDKSGSYWMSEGFSMMLCQRCNKISIWRDVDQSLIYPRMSTAPIGSTDMPPDVAADYNEAREVFESSPRAAGGLLRLAIQKLCMHLGQPGKNLNDDIGALVKGGLSPKVQQALDVVRDIGNNAVHPGEIDLKDDAPTVAQLFVLVNVIVDTMITQPKAIENMFKKLPDGAKRAIEKRDAPGKG